MPIGVLTWKLHNYGTALQAYALVHYISEVNQANGGCKLLNYTLPNKEHIVRVGSLTIWEMITKLNNRIRLYLKNRKNMKSELLFSESIKKQKERFEEFYGNIPQDIHGVSVLESQYFNMSYSKIIVGSDQVWSPKYFCNTYFLDFVEDCKKYAYAPSLGVRDLTKEERNYIKEKLEGFQRISVRETSGQKVLQKLLPNKEIVQVLDPTLLYDGDEWTRMLQLETREDKYILVYTLSNNAWYKGVIEKVKQEIAIEKVIYVTSNDNLYFFANDSELCVEAGPVEFLNLVKNAAFVITDSFHGVCFSLNFERQFICMERFKGSGEKHENARVIDLLSALELDDCYISQNLTCVPENDYDAVKTLLYFMRKKSQQYLLALVEE